jgi:predicted AAA+ superfamily ATPase
VGAPTFSRAYHRLLIQAAAFAPAAPQIRAQGGLQYYRFDDDSPQGRYHYLRLHPLSAAELGLETAEELATLLDLGAFPEPYFSGSQDEARRWSREHREFLLQEELRGLETVQAIGQLELRYFRDVDGREVDFVVTENRKPLWLIEAKRGDGDVSPGLRYLKERFPAAQAWQVSAARKKDFVSREGVRVAPALQLLSELV